LQGKDGIILKYKLQKIENKSKIVFDIISNSLYKNSHTAQEIAGLWKLFEKLINK
jgi:hypothetical protein